MRTRLGIVAVVLLVAVSAPAQQPRDKVYKNVAEILDAAIPAKLWPTDGRVDQFDRQDAGKLLEKFSAGKKLLIRWRYRGARKTADGQAIVLDGDPFYDPQPAKLKWRGHTFGIAGQQPIEPVLPLESLNAVRKLAPGQFIQLEVTVLLADFEGQPGIPTVRILVQGGSRQTAARLPD